MSLVCLSSANCFRALLCIIFRKGFLLGWQPCRPIWCSVRRMVWALTGWPPTPSTSAALLATLICLLPNHNLWIWRWARALNFFGRPWRGLFWVEPVLLKHCMVLATCCSSVSGSWQSSYSLRHLYVECKTGANVSVPMCLGPPSRGQKAPLRIHKSCLLHMSSRTQHTGGIHKAVSCICNSNIQGCSTLGDPHPVLTVPSFPPPLTTENSLKNPCNVICTNK